MKRVLLGAFSFAAMALVLLPSTQFGWNELLGAWAIRPTLVIGNVTALLMITLALLLVARRSAGHGSLSLALALSSAAFSWGMGTADAIQAPFDQLGRYLGTIVACGAFVAFTTRFPIPASVDEVARLRPLRQSSGVRQRLSACFASVLVNPALPFAFLAGLAGVGIVSGVPAVAGMTIQVAILATIVSGNLLHERTETLESARKQVRWIAAGLSVGSVVLMLVFGVTSVGWLAGPDYTLGLLLQQAGLGAWFLAMVIATSAVVVGILIAILAHGAFDPGLVIRRSLISGLLALVLPAVFAGIEITMTQLVSVRFALPPEAGPYTAGILSAVVLAPLWRWFSRRVDSGRLR